MERNIYKIGKELFITSDEEIKEGDYVTNGKYVSQTINEWWTKFYIGNPELKADYWKIILTTDQDLIQEGVQAVDDKFLEWLVKNPICDDVLVEKEYNEERIVNGKDIGDYTYKIIIPKEEIKLEDVFNDEKREGIKDVIYKHEFKVLTKEEVMEGRSSAYEFIDFDKLETTKFIIDDENLKFGIEPNSKLKVRKETIEESAERLNPYILNGRTPFKEGFIACAKWQAQRMYSEEDIDAYLDYYDIASPLPISKWFEQFKKK